MFTDNVSEVNIPEDMDLTNGFGSDGLSEQGDSKLPSFPPNAVGFVLAKESRERPEIPLPSPSPPPMGTMAINLLRGLFLLHEHGYSISSNMVPQVSFP